MNRERRHRGGEHAALTVFEAPREPKLEAVAVVCSALLSLCAGFALLLGVTW